MSTLVNPVGWFEIHVADMDRAKMFYESVFKRTLIEIPAPEAGMSMMIFASDPQGSGASGHWSNIPCGNPSCSDWQKLTVNEKTIWLNAYAALNSFDWIEAATQLLRSIIMSLAASPTNITPIIRSSKSCRRVLGNLCISHPQH